MARPTLYRMHIEPLRNNLLERLLERPEYWRDQIKAKIAEVPTYIDPRTCPDGLLKYLKDLVGMTDDIGITDDLTARELRKLIGLAIPIWKQKSIELGLVNLARLLTGKNVIYCNWFWFRWILGETGLWDEQAGSDPWILGGELTDYDEYFSNLRVMDSPDLDYDLLERGVEIERPSGERIEVVYLDMLDWFNEDLRYWSDEGAGVAYIDTTTHRMVIPVNGRERIVVPWISAWQYMVAIVSAWRGLPAALSYRLRFHVQDVNNCYVVELNPGSLVLIERLASAETPLATVTKTFLANQYKLRVETFNLGGGSIKVRVYIDADLEIEHTIGTPAFSQGHIEIDNPNVAQIEADNVEIFEKPLRYVLVGP